MIKKNADFGKGSNLKFGVVLGGSQSHSFCYPRARLGFRAFNDWDGWLIKSDTPKREKYVGSQYRSTSAAAASTAGK